MVYTCRNYVLWIKKKDPILANVTGKVNNFKGVGNEMLDAFYRGAMR
jgi:hypothetical protein